MSIKTQHLFVLPHWRLISVLFGGLQEVLFKNETLWPCSRWQSKIHSQSPHNSKLWFWSHFFLCQYSAYIMDERFPSVPMLKCDHMMQSPPIFCDVIPGSVFSGSAEDGAKTTKVLLGSHSSQEITMLQYSGQLMGVVRALPTKPWVHFWLIYLPKVKSSKYVSILVSGTEPEGSWDRTDICIKPCVCVCACV